MEEKGRPTPARFKLNQDMQKTMRFVFPHDIYDQVQFKTQISVFHWNDLESKPVLHPAPIDKGDPKKFARQLRILFMKKSYFRRENSENIRTTWGNDEYRIVIYIFVTLS